MDEEILSLKWNNHNSTFIHTLSSLHKLEMYSDVTLACDGKYFPVHKLVLSVCSEYFEEILSKTKCQHPVVVLKDIKHNDLEVLLNYMYAGEANVVQSELASLIKAAECLRIKGLAVPDETPPVRDKRHSELSETSHHHKKRRNDEGSSLNNNVEVIRELDKSENDQVENLNRERGQEELPVESHSEEQSNPAPAIDTDREGRKIIPEIVLEGEPIEVKQEVAEPKIEEHDESQQTLESKLDIAYSMNLGEDDNLENERQASDSQTSHILQDLMSHSLPGTSGVQGPDGISMWESNTASLPSYSVESYSSDDSRNHQMDATVLMRGALGLQQQQVVLKCPYCVRAFLYRSDLTRHLRSHTGEKPFTCPFCSYRGTQKTHLHEHIKRRHRPLFGELHDPIGTTTAVCSGTTTTVLHLPLSREEFGKPVSPLSPSSSEQTQSTEIIQ